MEIRPSEEDIEQAKRIVNKIIFDYQLDRTTLFTVCNSFNDHISRLICAERIIGEMEKRINFRGLQLSTEESANRFNYGELVKAQKRIKELKQEGEKK